MPEAGSLAILANLKNQNFPTYKTNNTLEIDPITFPRFNLGKKKMSPKKEFISDQYYHIYNRGTDKRKVFLDDIDFQRFLLSMKLMNFEQDGLMQKWRDCKTTNPNANLDDFSRFNLGSVPRLNLVEICCYTLIPNHYHFILKQVLEKGIEKFMQRLGTGYTMYFNKRYERAGALFQGRFKAIHIETTHHLQYLSAYVNCNSEVHGIARAEVYRWCSFPEYTGKRKSGLCDSGKKIILDDFRDGENYKKFAKVNAKHFHQKKLDEKLILEDK